MDRRLTAVAIVVMVGTAAAPSASGKDFGPGDLRVCGVERCVPVVRRAILPELGRFYYSGRRPRTEPVPRLGAPALELRFRNGYATGVVATRRLDRFLSFGVHLGRFRRGSWHRVPAALAAELRRLAVGLEPFRVTRVTLSRSR